MIPHICSKICNTCPKIFSLVLILFLPPFGELQMHIWDLWRSGGYLNPWPVGTSFSEVLSSACMDVILWGDFLFLVLMLLLPLAFSHEWYFSVLVWMSWAMLNFPHVVFTFTSTSRAPSGILQNRYPSRLQAAFKDLLYAILKLKFASICVVCDSNAGDLCVGVCYSHSHSRLYQDFLCFSMMFTCIRSLLPNNFLTFSLWMSGIRSIVGKCISLLFKIMWMFSHLISNTYHTQFFFRVTFSNDS